MTRFRLVVQPTVWRELRDIGAEIERDSTRRATSFTAEIIAKIESLALRPLSYRLRYDLQPGIRVCRHAPYLIIFMFDGATVTVIRVLHERRDLSETLRR